MLEFLSNLKTKHSDITDTETEKTDGSEMKKNLEFIEHEMPEFKNEILFFYEIENIEIDAEEIGIYHLYPAEIEPAEQLFKDKENLYPLTEQGKIITIEP